jgi:hypothetical protein
MFDWLFEMMQPFFWLALALPAVTDDFFTNLILVLVVPVIVVVGGLFVVKYLGAGMMQQAIKILLAVISFGFFVLYGNGLFMAIYEPSDPFHGEPLFWAPFTGLFLISTCLLLRRPVGRAGAASDSDGPKEAPTTDEWSDADKEVFRRSINALRADPE